MRWDIVGYREQKVEMGRNFQLGQFDDSDASFVIFLSI